MIVPNEIKTAVKDLNDFMRSIKHGNDKVAIHNEAMRLLLRIWSVREQIPTSEHSGAEYITDLEREFIRDLDSLTGSDRTIAESAIWAEKLIGHALDRYYTHMNVWQYATNREPVDTSWVESLVDRVIKRLDLTPRDLKGIGVRSRTRFPYIVKLDLVPLRGMQVLEEEVEDLTADQKQALADLMKYQGLPGDTTEGILASLYCDITKSAAPDFAELGAVCGLFYQVWLRLKRVESTSS